RRVEVGSDDAALGIEAIEPVVGAQPEGAVVGLGDPPDLVVAEAGGVAGAMPVDGDEAARRLEAAEASSIAAGPQPPLPVGVQAQGAGERGLQLVADEGPVLAVVEVQPTSGGARP